ncbi:MAG: bifunctional (p)ppGpp synthetase/guanosine-3',5'-bis(diphosphate) 3'-pyrophosphohydrolase [Pseudomonadota bacterium]|nr:bifunctional (p)ppGpp synthetase/guanosine-3',5'-bis(diphosphate) 3'-pyrophosphohydrolase [Pseudomonadota bacterium]MEC8496416.1 bifunctional (p)ppGpp synthetase/guanosine-3',5'-bis(diphosphate) 3'-pyrophosphohydrolase [Pseudomonadota bacterium]
MLNENLLIDSITKYNPATNKDLINRAFVIAEIAHQNQKRRSGDPYISHPLEVAKILTEYRLDDSTIITALLHDTIEDTKLTLKEVRGEFGEEIASLVDGLTKIGKLDLFTKEAEQAENFRKLILAMSNDVRVLIVKLADRLHNMRTINFLPEEKQQIIAKETIEVYAPLSGRLGIHSLKEELEELAFDVINPKARKIILDKLLSISSDSGELIDSIKADLSKEIKKNKINFTIEGREKKPFSIWRKMNRKSISLEQLSDIYGFRIIVNSIDDCYRIIGIVHQKWNAIPGRFKDYISTPKINDYQSIHTTILGPDNNRIELQIRTSSMNDLAERGVAAHRNYKDKSIENERQNYPWLDDLLEMLEQGESSQDFFESTKLELFQDQVFCFTPKGRIIALPIGATPIDFAFEVHTDVGMKCIGCRVNGLNAPLYAELDNGDEIEIITDDKSLPPMAWEKIALTGKAKIAIRRINKEKIKNQYSELGKQILDKLLKSSTDAKKIPNMKDFCKKFGLKSAADLYSKIGRGEITPESIRKAFLKMKIIKANEDPNSVFDPTINAVSIPVRGFDKNIPFKFADNSRVVPGDKIFGVIDGEEGITIYSKQSKNLVKYSENAASFIDLTWDIENNLTERYIARVMIDCKNEVGALAKITRAIGLSNANIENLKLVSRSRDFYKLDIDIGVFHLSHLNLVISSIRKIAVVHRVVRIME